MATASTRVAYRPARVGFLLRAGSPEDLRLAAQIATSLWGGVYNPMLPVEDIETGVALVRDFRPDVLYPVVRDELLDEVVQRFPHLSWPLSLEYFDGFTPHRGELPLLDVRPAMATLYDELRHHNASPWVLPTGGDDDLSALRAVLYGEYSDTTFADFYLGALRAGALPADQLPPGFQFDRTPLGVTTFGLDSPPIPMRSDGVVVCNQHDPRDLALYWNLRSLGVSVAFWPRDEDELRLRETALGFLETLARVEPGPFDFGIHLWSTTEWARPPELPAEIDHVLGNRERVFAHLDWWTFTQPLTMPRPALTATQSVLGSLESDGGGRTTLTFALPTTPFAGAESSFQQERLLAHTSLLVEHDETSTLRLPDLPDLNEWYDSELTVVRDGVRIGDGGVSTFVQAGETSLQLRLLRRGDVVRRVFERAGIVATPSSAGRAVDLILDQLGGLQGSRVLRAPGVRELLRTPKWRNWTTALAEIEKRGLPDQRNQTASQVLQGLLARRALVGALTLQCPKCGVRERYTLDAIEENMRCPRCRTEFSPSPLLHASVWEYVSSGFFADPGGHGAVSVLLTMMRLKQDSMHDRFVLASHNLHSDGIECESDLLVLEQSADGRFAVAIGECKTAGAINQVDLDNLSGVANRLHASGVECYLVFTTLRDEFLPEELERFRNYVATLEGRWSHDAAGLNSWKRPAPILLTPRELDQWEFYPADDRGDVPNHYNVGLREMAANSAARYLV